MRRIATLSWLPLLAMLGHAAADSSDMTTMRFIVVKPVVEATPPARPYSSVAVKPPAPLRDASLDAFRGEVAAAVRGRVYAELARLVAAQGFFWDRDFSSAFALQDPAVDNLAVAVRLEQGNGAGWKALARLAAEATATPLTGRPGIVCAPGDPSFDNVEFDRLLDATRSEMRDWAYPRTEGLAVHAAPKDDAAMIDMLDLALVRALDRSAGSNVAAGDTGWTRVATPAGKIGFVPKAALRLLSAERLCYGKDAFGRWRIAGYVSGE